MMNDRVLGIFKFGSRRRMEEFAQGLVYMKPLEYFIKTEDPVRKDPHEGSSDIRQGQGKLLQVNIGGKFVTVGAIVSPIRLRNPADLRANVFCMHG
jgi:hypothetical protein